MSKTTPEWMEKNNERQHAASLEQNWLGIQLKGVRAHTDENTGDVTITFPSCELSENDVKVLDRLFPNTQNAVDRALRVEELLKHIAL